MAIFPQAHAVCTSPSPTASASCFWICLWERTSFSSQRNGAYGFISQEYHCTASSLSCLMHNRISVDSHLRLELMLLSYLPISCLHYHLDFCDYRVHNHLDFCDYRVL
ncbi:hypothetical protein KP509_12G090600 [Ceratopteris richardii]|uniref:Uncharacterized protein n=1 Tax=Ceratopteris richardii TaxID=49495 RepID=A0A8T2TQU9_CERRI|nr:hypothetical protein KP509_12G090600 [Ceratopteris richardii]